MDKSEKQPQAESKPYSQRLDEDLDFALREGSRHFQSRSEVQKTLDKICRELKKRNIPFWIAGAMSLYVHGLRRFTEDVDLIVTREGLNRIHAELVGLGYVRLFPGSKAIRDVEYGVTIEFLISGDYPGDGKPKPVIFPEPQHSSEDRPALPLETLVELKLASGMTGIRRMRDLSDVVDLILELKLPREFSNRLHPFVCEKFLELYDGAHTEEYDPSK